MIVGLIGLGRMGAAMAERLAANGFEIVAWDRNPAACAALAATGQTAAPNARAVAEAASFVITTITEDNGVRGVFTGAGGLLEGTVADTLFIEMSTLQPATVRELEPQIAARGARIVDAPVLGTISNVRDGTLVAMLGGGPDDVAHARDRDVLVMTFVRLGGGTEQRGVETR